MQPVATNVVKGMSLAVPSHCTEPRGDEPGAKMPHSSWGPCPGWPHLGRMCPVTVTNVRLLKYRAFVSVVFQPKLS